MPNNTKKEEKRYTCEICKGAKIMETDNELVHICDGIIVEVSSPQSPVSEERERIIDWCKKRMELNEREYGTDKWNGDMEDLVELLSGNKE